MDCPTLNLWRPTPPGSTIAIEASGDEDDFTVAVRVNCLDGSSERWPHRSLVPGPKTRVMLAGDACAFTILMNVLNPPPAPIQVTATLTGPDGASLRSCDWHFPAPGSFAIVIDVLTS